MNIAINLVLVVVFLVILIYSARILEHAFVLFGKAFRINEFFLGFVILAVITNLPEISIATFSSKINPEISAGNLVGGIVIMITLILGMSAIKYKNISFGKDFGTLDIVGGVGVLLVTLFVFIDSQVSVPESVILLGSYISYVIFLGRQMRNVNHQPFHLILDNRPIYKNSVLVVIGIFALLISSNQIVANLEVIVESIGISGTFVGLILLSLGTNLPEITILLTASKSSEENLALGNFFGSACINVGILGMLGLLSNGFGITDLSTLYIGLFFLFFSCILFLYFSLTGRSLNRKEGILLVAVYISMIISQLILFL